MDEHDVRRLRSALTMLEQARNALEPAYRREFFDCGTVDSNITAVSALISLVLANEGEEPKKIVIVRVNQTCFGCPSQWDAWDEDGNQYYFRYRYGVGTLSLRGRMVDGTMEWLERSEMLTDFTNHRDDPMGGVIGLAEFVSLADGFELGGSLAAWTQ